MIIDMTIVNGQLISAKPYFKKLSPGWTSLFVGRAAIVARAIKTGMSAIDAYRTYKSGTPLATATGGFIGGQIIRSICRPMKKRVKKTHVMVIKQAKHDVWRKNGLGGRTWLTTTGHHQMVIVFHDANRAGPHIDVHIGRMSFVYRVKPELYSQLRYNREGYLTEDSRKLIINHIRGEIANGSRVPQNLDHSLSNARSTWVNGDRNGRNYGDGVTRQVVLESTVDIYKAHEGGPIEMFAPALNASTSLYLYPLYPGDDKRAPIAIWGQKSAGPSTVFTDRLHLQMIDPKDMDVLMSKGDMSTSTAKYDGSSCYVIIKKDGTTVWSPRTSVKTGKQIEYTPKINSLAHAHTNGETIVAMGELLFKQKTWRTYVPGMSDPYLPQSIGSGILNANAVLPKNIQPEIRLYRVDKVGRTNTSNMNFWDNRVLQFAAASFHQHLKVVELMSPEQALANGFEGVVVVPEDSSVNEGFKMKWWADANDWRIDSIDLYPGEKGGIAGVVWFTSLESGKQFKLGPSNLGDRDFQMQMIDNPDHYIGAVAKVSGRQGHEGRAAKMIALHDDKGLAPV